MHSVQCKPCKTARVRVTLEQHVIFFSLGDGVDSSVQTDPYEVRTCDVILADAAVQWYDEDCQVVSNPATSSFAHRGPCGAKARWEDLADDDAIDNRAEQECETAIVVKGPDAENGQYSALQPDCNNKVLAQLRNDVLEYAAANPASMDLCTKLVLALKSSENKQLERAKVKPETLNQMRNDIVEHAVANPAATEFCKKLIFAFKPLGKHRLEKAEHGNCA